MCIRDRVDALAVEADHVGLFAGDLESEVLDVEIRRPLDVRRLNQDVCTKAVRHRGSFVPAPVSNQGLSRVLANPAGFGNGFRGVGG